MRGNKSGGGGGGGDTLTTLDLDDGTITNAAMADGTTSLGTSSTLAVAATHGLPDAGMDAYFNLQQIDAPTAGQNKLLVVMAIPAAPSEDPGSSYAALGLVVAPDGTPASSEGAHGAITQTGTPTQRLGLCKRLGVEGTATAPDLGAGPYTVELEVSFDGTEIVGMSVLVKGASDAKYDAEDSQLPTGTYTNVWVGVFMGQKGASPTSIVTWSAVTVKYKWLSTTT